MPLARKVVSACHLSFLGRSAPEAGRALEPSAPRLTLSSLSLEPDVTDLSVDAGVFELELSRHGSRQGSRSNSRHPSIHGSASCWRPGQNEHLALCHAAVPSFLTRKVLDWSWPQGLAETQLLQDVVQLKPVSRGLDGFEVSLLADGLAARGWEVRLCCQGRRCNHKKAKSSGETRLDDLHHEYIYCSKSPDGEVMDTIIEPRFKELFQIGPATKLYAGLLESVPQQFVGHPTKLALLAELLSVESVAAFKENGWTVPPWRKVSSMLAKWGLTVPPKHAKDQSIRSGQGSPIASPGLLPPLPFEPARPMQASMSAAALDALSAARHKTEGDAAPQAESGTSQTVSQQQAPGGSFARMLLGGGLWGLQTEQRQESPPGPSVAEGNAQQHARGLDSQRQLASKSFASDRALQADSPSQPSVQGQEQCPSTSGHTMTVLPDSSQPAPISQLAKDLARAQQQPQGQQQRPQAGLNFLQPWSHLLPPMTTVKLTGGQQQQPQQKLRTSWRKQK